MPDEPTLASQNMPPEPFDFSPENVKKEFGRSVSADVKDISVEVLADKYFQALLADDKVPVLQWGAKAAFAHKNLIIQKDGYFLPSFWGTTVDEWQGIQHGCLFSRGISIDVELNAMDGVLVGTNRYLVVAFHNAKKEVVAVFVGAEMQSGSRDTTGKGHFTD